MGSRRNGVSLTAFPGFLTTHGAGLGPAPAGLGGELRAHVVRPVRPSLPTRNTQSLSTRRRLTPRTQRIR